MAFKTQMISTMSKPIVTVDFLEFYDRNEPDDAGQLADLYRSVRDVSEETFFETKAVNKGKILFEVTATSGDVLRLTKLSYDAFVRHILSQNEHSDLDIEDAANYEYAFNNPRA